MQINISEEIGENSCALGVTAVLGILWLAK